MEIEGDNLKFMGDDYKKSSEILADENGIFFLKSPNLENFGWSQRFFRQWGDSETRGKCIIASGVDAPGR